MSPVTAPLEDPDYTPQHPPVNGEVPDVVAKWGPRSQMRWFERYRAELAPQRADFWEQFYVEAAAHRGPCCSSCSEERTAGYGYVEANCCCRAIKGRGGMIG